MAVVALQDALPTARVMYCSATGASEPKNLAYMTRLGSFGHGQAVQVQTLVETAWYYRLKPTRDKRFQVSLSNSTCGATARLHAGAAAHAGGCRHGRHGKAVQLDPGSTRGLPPLVSALEA
jgi:hypothetical protein